MKYVYLTDNIVTDQAQVDPFSIFNADYAAQFIEAPDEVTHFWKLEDGQWVAPTPYTPTEAEITAAVSQARSLAYQKESDPLFFKAQRGEATMEEWLAKVEEIKARYPDGIMP